MSGKFGSLATFIFLVAIVGAANRAEENSGPPDSLLPTASGPMTSARGPASVMGKPRLMDVGSPLFRHTEKTHGPINAAIELVGDRPSKPGDIFVLKALLQSDLPLENVDFKWSLPKGLVVINGETKGRIVALQPGLPVEMQITLKTQTGEDHLVGLMAAASRGGTRFAEAAQYSTLLEPVRAAARQALQKSTAKAALDEGRDRHGELKVFH